MSLELRPSKFWIKGDVKQTPLGADQPIDPIDMNEDQRRIHAAVEALFSRIRSMPTLSLDILLDKVAEFNDACKVRSEDFIENWHVKGRQLGDVFAISLPANSPDATPMVMTYRLLSDVSGNNFYLEMIG